MLAAVRWGAVLLGVGAASLASTVATLLLWGFLAAIGVEDAPLAALTAGVVVGMLAGGFVAGRLAPYANRFHGALAGFGLAAIVLVVARLGGSPAPTPPVLALAALAIVFGGVGGLLGGRRRG